MNNIIIWFNSRSICGVSKSTTRALKQHKKCATVNQRALFPFQKIRFGLNQFLADDLTIIADDDVVSKIFFSKVAPRQMFDIHNMFRNYKQLPDRPNICSKNGKDLSNKNVLK